MAKANWRLGDTTVSRGGLSTNYVNTETSNVRLLANEEEMMLSFSISSKGGGSTYIQVAIGQEDFGTILTAMTTASRQAAMLAMSHELSSQIAAQPEHDVGVAKSAQDAVSELAEQKYADAPTDDDDKERLISTSVKRLIDELRKSNAEE